MATSTTLTRATWVVLPNDEDLWEESGWKKIGKDTYAAVRIHLLVVPRRGPDRAGEAERSTSVPVGTKISRQRRRTRTEVYSDELQETLERTVSSKLTREFVRRVGSSAETDVATLKVNLTEATERRFSEEIMESMRTGFARKTAYQITLVDEEALAWEDTVPDLSQTPRGSTAVVLFPKFRTIYWDIYLDRAEYVRVHTKSILTLRTGRAADISVEADLDLPFCRIQFYEPYDELSLAYGEHVPDVEYPQEIEILSLNEARPARRPTRPGLSPLGELGALAFPVSLPERYQARRRKHRAMKAARPSRGRGEHRPGATVVGGKGYGPEAATGRKTTGTSKHGFTGTAKRGATGTAKRGAMGAAKRGATGGIKRGAEGTGRSRPASGVTARSSQRPGTHAKRSSPGSRQSHTGGSNRPSGGSRGGPMGRRGGGR